jgi:transcription initiation factor TFIID subunit 5
VKISPDGRYLASAGVGDGYWNQSKPEGSTPASDDTSISLWDLASGRRIKRMWGHTATVHDLDFSSDGNLLISGGADCTVRCWDVKGPAAGRPSKTAMDLAVKSGTGSASANPHSYHWKQQSSADCIATFFTKQTPIIDVHFTPRNLCMVSGAFDPTSA